MSGVHDSIALAAMDVLPEAIRQVVAPYREDLKKAAWYPDSFADRTMPASEKHKIDPDADRFIYPDPPDTDTQHRLEKLSAQEAQTGVTAWRQVYLTEHYLRAAVAAAKAGDIRAAVKFCGVYSHTIADTAEPIHAINPDIIDLVVPPPPKHVAMELHANVEGLCAPVEIAGYQPQLLGATVEQAIMGAIAGLVQAKQAGAAQTVPIVQALYTDNRAEATRLSSLAQSASARATADFLYTVLVLANLKTTGGTPVLRSLDLRLYPYAGCCVDMLYRYRPMVDLSLIPYSGGKSHPLSLRTASGGIERVHGLGVAPYLGPPYTPDHHRETTIDYLLVPGAFRAFHARVGANPLFEKGIVTMVFRVLADGREIFRSRDLSPRDAAVDVSADISGANWLTLSMHFSSNPTFEDVMRLSAISWANHGVWAKPRLD